MTILWSFSHSSFVKFHVGQKYGGHNMTALYPNPSNNEVCYKMTALYCSLDISVASLSLHNIIQKHTGQLMSKKNLSHMHSPILKIHAQLSRRIISLSFEMSLHILSYFVYTSSKSSDKPACMCWHVESLGYSHNYAISTKISCAGSKW